MVLFLTTLMLMNLNVETEKNKPVIAQIAALVVSTILGLCLVWLVRKAGYIMPAKPLSADIGMIKSLGVVLLDEYFYPFEFISILLLSAMAGVVLLTKKEKRVIA